METILKYIGILFFKLSGWTYEELPEYWTGKHVVVGFPHTSNMDTVRAFAYMKIAKVKGHILIKSSWFIWPMSVFLKRIGGLPVNRGKAIGTVNKLAEEFKKSDKFILSIVPEGTRKKVTKVKLGFWYIAKNADVSILCWFLDNKNKSVKWVGTITPGNSAEKDLDKIRYFYKKHGLIIP